MAFNPTSVGGYVRFQVIAFSRAMKFGTVSPNSKHSVAFDSTTKHALIVTFRIIKVWWLALLTFQCNGHRFHLSSDAFRQHSILFAPSSELLRLLHVMLYLRTQSQRVATNVAVADIFNCVRDDLTWLCFGCFCHGSSENVNEAPCVYRCFVVRMDASTYTQSPFHAIN